MICQFKNSNISTNESNIRLGIGVILALIAFYYQNTIIIIMALALILSGFFKFCFLYEILGINSKLKKKNSFFYSLPKNNPQPVFVMNNIYDFIYQNDSSKKYFTDKDDLKIKKHFLKNIDFEKVIDKQITQIQYKLDENNIFLFELKYDKELEVVLVYGTDITNVMKAEQEILKTQKDIIYAMGEIGETRSKETGNHVKRVALYSELLALKCGLNLQEAELIKLASPMHDIGKVGIEDKILNKPGKLTEDEFEIMKTHSILGYNMLKNSEKPILKAASIVAHEHHEKWDGSGYPRGLKKEEIPLSARIVAIADVFDALFSKRVYKEKWNLTEIENFFKENSSFHFDPKLCDLFLQNIDQFRNIYNENPN